MCLASCHQGQLCKIISIVWISHQQLSLERCLWFSRLMGRPGRSAMGGGEKQQFLCSLPLTLACYTGFLIKTKQGTLWTRCFGSTTKKKACDSKSGVIHSICEPTCTSEVGSSWILAAGCSYFFSLIYLQPPHLWRVNLGQWALSASETSGDEDVGNRMKCNGTFLVPNLREKQSFIPEYTIS